MKTDLESLKRFTRFVEENPVLAEHLGMHYVLDEFIRLTKRVVELEDVLSPFGVIHLPLMEINDTAHASFYMTDNNAVQKYMQNIATEVEKADKARRDVFHKGKE